MSVPTHPHLFWLFLLFCVIWISVTTSSMKQYLNPTYISTPPG